MAHRLEGKTGPPVRRCPSPSAGRRVPASGSARAARVSPELASVPRYCAHAAGIGQQPGAAPQQGSNQRHSNRLQPRSLTANARRNGTHPVAPDLTGLMNNGQTMPAPMATKPPSALTHRGARASLFRTTPPWKMPRQNNVKAHRPNGCWSAGLAVNLLAPWTSRPDSSRQHPASSQPTPVKTSANGKRKICNRQRMDGSTKGLRGLRGVIEP